MVDGTTPQLEGPEFDKLREAFLKEKFYKFQPLLQKIEDPNWGKPIKVPINDAIYEFRKFTHSEVALVHTLPYSKHLNALDEHETKDFQIFKRLMVERIATEPGRWIELTRTEPRWADIVFNTILNNSLVDVAALNDFFSTDYGWSYGLIWFLTLHMTPTQVGAQSEGDFQAVTSFFNMNHEKIWGKKP